MTVAIENLIADFNASIAEVQVISLVCSRDQRAVQYTHQELLEESYERRIRVAASNRAELEKVVQRQAANRCLHMSAMMAFRESYRRLEKAHSRFKTLFAEIAGATELLSEENAAKILQDVFELRKDLSWFGKGSEETLKLTQRRESWVGSVDSVYRRAEQGDLSGFTVHRHGLMMLTPIYDASQPEYLNSRLGAAIAKIQQLVHPEAFDKNELLSVKGDPIAAVFIGRLPRREPLSHLLHRFQDKPRYPIQDADMLASALLADDKAKIADLNLCIGIRDATKELTRCELEAVLKPLREAIYDLRKLLLEARNYIGREHVTHIQLNYLCGSLALQETKEYLDASTKVDSYGVSALKNALTLLAAEEAARNLGA